MLSRSLRLLLLQNIFQKIFITQNFPKKIESITSKPTSMCKMGKPKRGTYGGELGRGSVRKLYFSSTSNVYVYVY